MALDKPESVGGLPQGVPGHYLVEADVVVMALLVGEGGAAIGGVDGHPRIFAQDDVISARMGEVGDSCGLFVCGSQNHEYCKWNHFS